MGHQIDISRSSGTLKMLAAVMTAAAVAALVTFFIPPGMPVEANPVAKPVETAMMVSVNQPWPYLHGVGTPPGNAHVRLITTDKFAP
jgi:hypothetical protein